MKPPGPRWNRGELPRLHPTAAEQAQPHSARAEAPAPSQAGEEERRLARLLHRLPNAPVSPGFTARVLAALDQETEALPNRFGRWTGWRVLWPWIPRLAGAFLLLLLPFLWWHQPSPPPTRLAQSLASVTRPVQEAGLAAQMPAVEVLIDFEAIDQMRQFSALVDEDLLASLEVPAP